MLEVEMMVEDISHLFSFFSLLISLILFLLFLFFFFFFLMFQKNMTNEEYGGFFRIYKESM